MSELEKKTLAEEELAQVSGGDGAGDLQVGDWCAFDPVIGKIPLLCMSGTETLECACKVSSVSPLMLKGYVCKAIYLRDGRVFSHCVEFLGEADVAADEVEPIPAPWWAKDVPN